MVTYEYACDVCEERFEVKQHLGDPAPPTCPEGHPNVRRVFSAPTIVFKGPGFYTTDHKRSTRTASSKGNKSKKK